MERGCPYLYTGSKFRVIWPSVLIIQGGLQQSPLGKYVWEKPSGEQGLKAAVDFHQQDKILVQFSDVTKSQSNVQNLFYTHFSQIRYQIKANIPTHLAK